MGGEKGVCSSQRVSGPRPPQHGQDLLGHYSLNPSSCPLFLPAMGLTLCGRPAQNQEDSWEQEEREPVHGCWGTEGEAGNQAPGRVWPWSTSQDVGWRRSFLLCEVHPGLWERQVIHLDRRPCLRESGRCASSPRSTAKAGTRPRKLHKQRVTLTLKGRKDSDHLIPMKARSLREAEMGATFRFLSFFLNSAFYV